MVNENADTGRRPCLTDVPGILVGHFTHSERPTGCTVILSEAPMVAGVDVRGGAPGTRETDLLRPENTVPAVHGIFLSGGSAFGLDVGTGVMKFLEERGAGYPVGDVRIPVVCGAILFDLHFGDARIRPDASAGYEAARNASSNPVLEGNIGAGAGCRVGKMFGVERSVCGGLGSWAWRRSDGLCVAALVAVNAMGDVVDPASNAIVAGALKSDGDGFIDAMAQLRRGYRPQNIIMGGNTVIGVIATNATLDKAHCTVVARMAQDALARCIQPAHTPMDGDTIFAVATSRHSIAADPVELAGIGAMAADVLSTAIVRACRERGRLVRNGHLAR
jgi:L-aminopeptidase/D-esterase-like protein